MHSKTTLGTHTKNYRHAVLQSTQPQLHLVAYQSSLLWFTQPVDSKVPFHGSLCKVAMAFLQKQRWLAFSKTSIKGSSGQSCGKKQIKWIQIRMFVHLGFVQPW